MFALSKRLLEFNSIAIFSSISQNTRQNIFVNFRYFSPQEILIKKCSVSEIDWITVYSETKLGANDNKEKQRFERQ